MGMISAILGTMAATPRDNGLVSAVRRRAMSFDAKGDAMLDDGLRDATLEDGLRQLIETIEGLSELDVRIADVERDLVGASPVKLDDLPAPKDIGLNGYVPRLMEAALLIGAITRRAHLRLGLIEAALGLRARPVENPDESQLSLQCVDAAQSGSQSSQVSALDLDDDILELINKPDDASSDAQQSEAVNT